MPKITTIEGDVEVPDLLKIDWSTFPFTLGYFTHQVVQHEVLQPYLIAARYFNNVAYEDVLLLINNVINPLDLFPGMKLKIPNEADIKAFIASKV